MSKRVLITAGTVYGKLDDNKLVGNRARGVWAARFAHWLWMHGHEVLLLVADIQHKQIRDYVESLYPTAPCRVRGGLEVISHQGFWDYQTRCFSLARVVDAAVMAAAVVNWIPKTPITGKMATKGFTPGKAEIHVPFLLAPRVIDGMRRENSTLTLIGCKMLAGADDDTLMEQAYHTLISAKCHAVIANDMVTGLKKKTVLYPDCAQFDFDLGSDRGSGFYQHLEEIITDEHFSTSSVDSQHVTRTAANTLTYRGAEELFDLIVRKYRERFVRRQQTNNLVFGAVAVRTDVGALCSPREKGQTFTSWDAVEVITPTDEDCDLRRIRVVNVPTWGAEESQSRFRKATMNAWLLLRHLQTHPKAAAVLHLHEQLPSVPTMPYAPPGTVRDNLREIPGPIYNIEGHGCIVALDQRGEFL